MTSPNESTTNIFPRLRELIQRKTEVTNMLTAVEQQIYALEESYLTDSLYGNVIHGWKRYSPVSIDNSNRTINEADRLFSISSVTSAAAVNGQFVDVRRNLIKELDEPMAFSNGIDVSNNDRREIKHDIDDAINVNDDTVESGNSTVDRFDVLPNKMYVEKLYQRSVVVLDRKFILPKDFCFNENL